MKSQRRTEEGVRKDFDNQVKVQRIENSCGFLVHESSVSRKAVTSELSILNLVVILGCGGIM